MLFLVHMIVNLPKDLPQDVAQEVLAKEKAFISLSLILSAFAVACFTSSSVQPNGILISLIRIIFIPYFKKLPADEPAILPVVQAKCKL